MSGISDPFSDGYQATPSNTNLRRGGDGIYVATDGNLEVMTLGGTVIGPVAVVAGSIFPFRVSQVRTGTTATVIVGTH